jgi:hypothetical protein
MKKITVAGVEETSMKGRKALAPGAVLNYNKNQETRSPLL